MWTVQLCTCITHGWYKYKLTNTSFLQHIEEVVSYTNLNVNITATKGRTTLSSLIISQMTILCKTPEHINRWHLTDYGIICTHIILYTCFRYCPVCPGEVHVCITGETIHLPDFMVVSIPRKVTTNRILHTPIQLDT